MNSTSHSNNQLPELQVRFMKEQPLNLGGNYASTLTQDIPTLSDVCDKSNIKKATGHVISKKGCPGVDKKNVHSLDSLLTSPKQLEDLRKQVLFGNYVPKPLLEKKIPKGNGKFRTLSIPTVQDRVIQQIVLQVLNKRFDSSFSDYCFAYRPRIGINQAVLKAQEHIQNGKTQVIELDIEKFFDNMSHEILLAQLKNLPIDIHLVNLIELFLKTDLQSNGSLLKRSIGCPQGGNLSPFLSNLYFLPFDKFLEANGINFIRYADDVSIFTEPNENAQELQKVVTDFLTNTLLLKVNLDKCGISPYTECNFLGFSVHPDRIIISDKAYPKLKEKVCTICNDTSIPNFTDRVNALKQSIKGWCVSKAIAEADINKLDEIDSYLISLLEQRHRKCMIKLKSCSSYPPSKIPNLNNQFLIARRNRKIRK